MAVLAGAYYALALLAALRRPRYQRSIHTPPVSILKPLYGRDPGLAESLRSHEEQDYPEYEILYAAKPGDEVATLAPVVEVTPAAPNAKVGLLAALAPRARYPLLLVNDADIRVERDYLRRVVAPLMDPRVGLVTCLYRARGDSLAARWEALGIATEFAPSVLVARLIGVVEFALGSTLLVRAADLERIGGFAALGHYLADDYQLGKHITSLGYRVAFADVVVETRLGAPGWAQTWRRQLRWARTARVSRPAGYLGYVVTHATLWSLAAWVAGAPWLAAGTFALRMAAGVAVGAGVLGDRNVLRLAPLIPLRDLWGFLVWAAGLFGNTVEWRGRRLRLDRKGRIVSEY